MRKMVSLLILCCMLLHASGRLGVISYLYQQRHTIAYHAGIIAEIPIALCKSDFDFNKGIHFDQQEESDNLPVNFTVSQELLLYIDEDLGYTFSLFKNPGEPAQTILNEVPYKEPSQSIFHPPCIG